MPFRDGPPRRGRPGRRPESSTFSRGPVVLRFLRCAGLAAVAVLWVAWLPVLAGTPVGVKGTVIDRDGTPIPGATVRIANPAIGLDQGAVSDAKGEFRVVPLSPGRGYSLSVSFPGMATVVLPDVDLPPSRI